MQKNSLVKSVLYFACSVVISAMASAQDSTDEIPSNPVLQKAYQQVLYDYYQGDFAEGLTKISILEQQHPNGLLAISESLRGDIIEPELLKGAMSLAYGLNAQAAEIFTRLLRDKQSEKVSAYAWLLLGEAHHRSREFEQAAKAFANISMEQADTFFDTTTRDHWLYLQSQLHGFLINSDTPKNTRRVKAQSHWLQELSDDSIYRQYIAYNQALGLLQNGEVELAISELDSLASTNTGLIESWGNWVNPLFDAEQKAQEEDEKAAIKDRANLTLAYVLMQQGEPHDAFRAFEKIRTEGLDYDGALLGYGWAAAEKGDWQIALAIWQKLIQMPQHSEFTLEAYIASAYAYEKAFAPKQAMNMLQSGVARFKQASNVLEMAHEQVSQPQFILDLIPSSLNLEKQSDSYELLSEKGQQLNTQFIFKSISVSNEFKAGIEALKASLEIQTQLLNWQQRMSQYHLMLDERKVERNLRAENMSADRTLDKLADLKEVREQLAAHLQRAEELQDGSVFMSAQYQDWVKRVKRSQLRLKKIAQLKSQLNQTPLAESYANRLDVVAGRLTWLSSEALPANMWQAKKALALLDQELLTTEKRQYDLLSQLARAPLYAEQWQRVDSIAARLTVQIQKNEVLQQNLITQLSVIFKQAIVAHQDKVSNYLLQAQLATVRLSDQALQNEEGDLIEQGQTPKDNSQ
ncbi:tetratricopeptide repeat protein [Paraglaciecola sp.]|uniref:tetratricopeptide repeat protein n=1 Tax=Paraglaciecola sp. TaxID=1920173 RepID=UPI003265E33D